MSYTGLILDGPLAGERRSHGAPYLAVAVIRRVPAPMSFVEAPRIAPIEHRHYRHVTISVAGQDAGFWVPAEVDEPDNLYILRTLIAGFRPRPTDPEERYRAAVQEVEAAARERHA